MSATHIFSIALLLSMISPSLAVAGCMVKNTTNSALVIKSGYVSNQRVGPMAQANIDDGALTGKAEDGRTFSGQCPDNGKIEIRDVGGNLQVSPAR